MGVEDTKTITLFGDGFDPARSRREVGAAALICGVTVVSFSEEPKRLSTKLVVIVSGHPRRLREFHDMVRGDAWSSYSGSGILDSLIVGATVEGARFVKRKWQGRNDPPLDELPDLEAPRTTVYWRSQGAEHSEDAIGAVWVDTYQGRSTTPISSEQWPEPARRAEALAYAREHGFTFWNSPVFSDSEAFGLPRHSRGCFGCRSQDPRIRLSSRLRL